MRSLTLASLPLVTAQSGVRVLTPCGSKLDQGSVCCWSRHSLTVCVLTAMCGANLDQGVLAVGNGTVLRFVCSQLRATKLDHGVLAVRTLDFLSSSPVSGSVRCLGVADECRKLDHCPRCSHLISGPCFLRSRGICTHLFVVWVARVVREIGFLGRRLQAYFHILQQLGWTTDTVHTSLVGGVWKFIQWISTCGWAPDPGVWEVGRGEEDGWRMEKGRREGRTLDPVVGSRRLLGVRELRGGSGPWGSCPQGYGPHNLVHPLTDQDKLIRQVTCPNHHHLPTPLSLSPSPPLPSHHHHWRLWGRWIFSSCRWDFES